MNTVWAKRILAAVALAALTACGPPPSTSSVAQDAYAPIGRAMGGEKAAMDAPMEEAAAPEAAMAPAPVPPPPPPPGQPAPPQVPGTPPGGVLIAYSYTNSLEVPALRVSDVMKAHEKKCVDAGAAVCQVLGSNTSSYGENDIRAQLTLRGEPRWLATFRAGLAGDAKSAGGEMKSESTSSQDLTRDIIDTEATLRAQKQVRENLQEILRSRPGRLSDVLEVERELARVQQVIDSSESNLAVMRTRVAMSTLTLDYTSADAPVTDRTFEPIKEALVRFFGVIAEGIGVMIIIVATVLPWVLVGWLLLWLFGKWRKRVAARKAAAKAAEAAQAAQA